MRHHKTLKELWSPEQTEKSNELTHPKMEDKQKLSLSDYEKANSNKMKEMENNGETDPYTHPTSRRSGMRDAVWENAKVNGRVRDSVTGQFMSKDKPWDMGHKPGYEFKKHRESAIQRGIDRKTFLDEYNNPQHLRPELPSSNRSHKGEDKTDAYFGD